MSTMFARQAFRAVQPLKQASQNVRRYANGPGVASGSNTTAIYGLVAGAAALGGGFYYYRVTDPKRSATPSSANDPNKQQSASAPVSSEERKTVPASPSPSASAPQSKAFKGGDQGFIDLKLESVEDINHNTKKFRFALPDSNDVSGLQIASALITKYKGPEMEKPVIRPYTPVSDEDARGYLDFVIKKYPNGPMSEHMHSMNPGQRLDFKGPIPKFPWESNKYDHIALIGGGTGITPLYQLARAIFKNPNDKTKVTLIYGNISEPDILLKRELKDLENEYPQRFRAFYTLDKPPEGWTSGKGFITKELLKTVLPDSKKGDDVKIFVCGPPPLYKAISGAKKSPSDQGELEGALKELGYGKDQVYKF